MTDFEVLEQIFPADIACNILRFRSHPTADLLKGLIHEWKHFKKLSVRGLLGFNHYCRNKRTLRWAERDMLYVNGCVNRGSSKSTCPTSPLGFGTLRHAGAESVVSCMSVGCGCYLQAAPSR
jgi:hypothetical protein